MTETGFKILAGLGNPGDKYARTRHNIGFSVIEELASSLNLSLDKIRFDCAHARAAIKNTNVFLLKPQSYMNKSGYPIHKFASYYKVDIKDIIIVHDDMDLAPAQIKIVKSRGHGGHNGIKSIINVFGKNEFVRVRIGVGHPENSQKDVTGHVLGGFSPDERLKIDQCIKTASDACVCILEKGAGPAMNLFNTKR